MTEKPEETEPEPQEPVEPDRLSLKQTLDNINEKLKMLEEMYTVHEEVLKALQKRVNKIDW